MSAQAQHDQWRRDLNCVLGRLYSDRKAEDQYLATVDEEDENRTRRHTSNTVKALTEAIDALEWLGACYYRFED